MTSKYPTDFTDRVIKSGDTIVYPVRRGGDMWLSSARVSTITRGRGDEWLIECVTTTTAGRPQRVVLRQPKRCMVVDNL